MPSYKPNDASTEWLRLIEEIAYHGSIVSPRKMPIRELAGFQTKVDMRNPIVMVPERKMGYKFLFAEAWWILSGRKDLESIKPYSNAISRFSDDKETFDGAYGPMVVEQLRFVADTLLSDRDSRQAVLTIWRPNPRPSKDIPCTLALQFFIRGGCLHCNATMRSSDAWLGWVYDVFNFSMVAYLVREHLVARGLQLMPMGTLTITAGSQHLYEPQWYDVDRIVAKYVDEAKPIKETKSINGMFQFDGNPGALINMLEILKDEPLTLIDEI